MRDVARWKYSLGIQSIFAQSAWAGVRIMAGYHALAYGAGPLLLAVLTAVFAVPALAAAVPAGRLTDRIGGSVVSLAGAVLGSVGILGMMLIPGLPALLIFCAVVGLGNLFSMVGQQTFVAHLARGRKVDEGFGFLSATASAGQAIGPLLATLAATFAVADQSEPNTIWGFAVTLVLTASGVFCFGAMRKIEPKAVPVHSSGTGTAKASHWEIGRPIWRALVVSGLVLVTIDMLYTFIPLWAQERNVSANAVGLLLALRATVSMFSRLGLGRLVARWGRRPLLVTATTFAAVALTFLPVVGIGGAAACMVLLGVGLGIPQPLTMAWAVAVTNARFHGMVLGMRLSANRLAQIVVPMGIGAMAVPLGAMSVFYANAGLMLVSAAISVKTPPR